MTKMKKFHRSLIMGLLILHGACQPAAAGASVEVILKNGNTLSADSYRVEKNRLHLKYPLGEVEFPLSQVKSIKGDDGASLLFRDKGRKEAASRPQVPDKQTRDREKLRQWLDQHPQKPPVTEAEKKADSFLDRFFSSSEQEQEGMEEEWESLSRQLQKETQDSEKIEENGEAK